MKNNFAALPVKPYPQNLEESLKIFEKLEYESFGFPMVFLDYNYHFKCWGVSFRNPAKFSDPNIQEKSPLDAVHKMFDFLNEIKTR